MDCNSTLETPITPALKIVTKKRRSSIFKIEETQNKTLFSSAETNDALCTKYPTNYIAKLKKENDILNQKLEDARAKYLKAKRKRNELFKKVETPDIQLTKEQIEFLDQGPDFHDYINKITTFYQDIKISIALKEKLTNLTLLGKTLMSSQDLINFELQNYL